MRRRRIAEGARPAGVGFTRSHGRLNGDQMDAARPGLPGLDWPPSRHSPCWRAPSSRLLLLRCPRTWASAPAPPRRPPPRPARSAPGAPGTPRGAPGLAPRPGVRAPVPTPGQSAPCRAARHARSASATRNATRAPRPRPLRHRPFHLHRSRPPSPTSRLRPRHPGSVAGSRPSPDPARVRLRTMTRKGPKMTQPPIPPAALVRHRRVAISVALLAVAAFAIALSPKAAAGTYRAVQCHEALGAGRADARFSNSSPRYVANAECDGKGLGIRHDPGRRRTSAAASGRGRSPRLAAPRSSASRPASTRPGPIGTLRSSTSVLRTAPDARSPTSAGPATP